jgi:hypothetical protein
VILAEFTLPKTVEKGSLSRTVNSTAGLASIIFLSKTTDDLYPNLEQVHPIPSSLFQSKTD